MKNFLVFLVLFQMILYCKENISEIILKRNIFKPIEKQKIEPVRKIPEIENIDKYYSLLGTVEFDEKDKSIAIFEDLKSKEIIFVKNGEQIKNFKIIDIKKEGVFIKTITEEDFLFTTSGLRKIEFSYPKKFFVVNLKEFIEELKNDKEQLNSLKVTLVNKNAFSGYKINGIKEGSIIEKTGLLNNDIILKINGIKMDKSENPFKIYEDILKNGKNKVSVEILRENRVFNNFYFLE
ncbi:MAG: hypothetical protein NC833_06920 [Candidatus Omnitrophica bacterium]|nr:hypothetical protein [Candidatus Omnitrophota bacterium]